MVQNPGAFGAHQIAKKATEERGLLKVNVWSWKCETGRPIVRVWGQPGKLPCALRRVSLESGDVELSRLSLEESEDHDALAL